MVAIKKLAAVDTTGWLTRTQVMDLLGVSTTSLYRWERQGRLHPSTGQRDGSVRMVVVYDPAEVARLPRKLRADMRLDTEGEIMARVFELFEEGRSVREIVLRTRQTIAKIEALHEAWLDAGGAELVIGKAAKYELEKFIGKFATVGDLVERITDAFGMPLTGSPISEVIERGQREVDDGTVKIEAKIAANIDDKTIERGIVRALDAAGAP